jgi:hypothetical protein
MSEIGRGGGDRTYGPTFETQSDCFKFAAAGVPRRLNDGRFDCDGEMPLPWYIVIEGANSHRTV